MHTAEYGRIHQADGVVDNAIASNWSWVTKSHWMCAVQTFQLRLISSLSFASRLDQRLIHQKISGAGRQRPSGHLFAGRLTVLRDTVPGKAWYQKHAQFLYLFLNLLFPHFRFSTQMQYSYIRSYGAKGHNWNRKPTLLSFGTSIPFSAENTSQVPNHISPSVGVSSPNHP